MINRLLAFFAFATLVGFLGILVLWVPRVDIAVIVGLTIVLVGIDFFLKSESKH